MFRHSRRNLALAKTMSKYSLDLPTGEFPESATVTPASRLGLRRNVERFAEYFKRELKYDISLFCARESSKSPVFVPYEGHLFHVPADDMPGMKVRYVGAAVFRRREAHWVMQWVWIHPFFRREGHLSRSWRDYQARYGEFVVEGPYSLDMQAFLRSKTSSA